MKKRLFALVLAAVMLLSGCSLAVGEGGNSGADGQLVGVFLTISQQNGMTDVWDAELAGMEPLHRLESQGQKLMATRQETADAIAPHTWVFPEGLGLLHANYYVPAEGENVGFWSVCGDAEFSDSWSYIGSDDDGTHVALETTLYIAGDAADLIVYIHPVYQMADGRLYAQGTGEAGYHAVSMYDCSKTISQELPVRLADGTKTTGGEVTLTFKQAVLPQRYAIVEMDEHNQVLRTTEYTPEQMPETFAPGGDAAYLILESRGADTITRTVYSPDDTDQTMDTFYPGRYGICIKGYTHIKWEG